MIWTLEQYRRFVGDEIVDQIHEKAGKLRGRHILHINSTYQGGGVAEILSRLVPLMNEIGIAVGWRTLHGSPDFFMMTKKFHNALQGEKIRLTKIKKGLYIDTNELFSTFTHIDHDCVVIHDPQPLPLIEFYKKKQPWIWRCHIDLTNPQKEVWEYVKNFILKYDMTIFSHEKYKKPGLPMPQRIVYPCIDPFSLKNKNLLPDVIPKYLKRLRIPTDKPIITQVSRLDKWKDPEGVFEVFKLVKTKIDCRLIYCYNFPPDDPEGIRILTKTSQKMADFLKSGEIIFVRGDNQIVVNVVQRISEVIIQKSIREGFCLSVTEALWKEKPVVASNIGGIPIQIKDGENGFLVEPDDVEEFADRIIRVLKNRDLSEKMGKRGKEIVREKFLITRLVLDYLDLLNEIIM